MGGSVIRKLVFCVAMTGFRAWLCRVPKTMSINHLLWGKHHKVGNSTLPKRANIQSCCVSDSLRACRNMFIQVHRSVIPSLLLATWSKVNDIPSWFQNIIELCSDSPPQVDHKLLVPSTGGGHGAKAKYGIYHTPEQFVKFARTLTHPVDVENRVPDVLRMSIFNMLCGGVQNLANKRLEQSKRLTQLRYELRFEEARLHALLSPHARVVLKGKSIVLFRHLRRSTGSKTWMCVISCKVWI